MCDQHSKTSDPDVGSTRLVRASLGLYQCLPADAFCSLGQLKAKNEYRREVEAVFGKPFAGVIQECLNTERSHGAENH